MSWLKGMKMSKLVCLCLSSLWYHSNLEMIEISFLSFSPSLHLFVYTGRYEGGIDDRYTSAATDVCGINNDAYRWNYCCRWSVWSLQSKQNKRTTWCTWVCCFEYHRLYFWFGLPKEFSNFLDYPYRMSHIP